MKINGIASQHRVKIEGVDPEIDGGLFYAKGIVGQNFEIECDLFSDGHVLVNGQLLHRYEGNKNWEKCYLTSIENDRWLASFKLNRQGFYEYTLEGWVDHALTWQHELTKKFEGDIKVDVELQDGIQYFKNVLLKCDKSEAKLIRAYLEELKNPKRYKSALKKALSKQFSKLFLKYPHADYPTAYNKILRVFADRKKAEFSAWYEFFPRSTAAKANPHGTFRDCENLLDRIIKMGFDTIYFPPVHPIGVTHRKGKNNTTIAGPDDPGVPWGIGTKTGGHKSIHPELGSLKDFKSLVKRAKSKGLEIALDLAFQCSPDHPYVKRHPDWFKWRSDGTVQYAENPPKKYQDILPINFESKDWRNLWNELLSIPLYWNKLGIKLFRVDNPHTKPFGFWQWLIAEVKKVDPDVLFLSEAFTRPKIMHQLAKVGFTQSYTYYTWRNSKWELIDYMHELTNSPGKHYFRPNFWPNTPDINPIPLQNGNENLFLIRFFMASTLASSYGIYGPVYEFMEHEPIPGAEEYMNSEKYQIRHWMWGKKNKLTSLITKINRIRQENQALHHTTNFQNCKIENDNIFAYFKNSPDANNNLLMIVNLDPHNKQEGWVQVPLFKIDIKPGEKFSVKDLLTNERFTWNQEWNQVILDPAIRCFHLFRIEK